MTDIAKKKEDVKKGIRALLISSPLGLTYEQLQRDYHDFFGTALPCKEFGYNSAEDFIHNIPDVVDVNFNGGMMILKAVSDSTTRHIEKMVSRQKVDSKKKWALTSKWPSSGSSRPRPLISSWPSKQHYVPPQQRRPVINNYAHNNRGGRVALERPGNYHPPHHHHRTYQQQQQQQHHHQNRTAPRFRQAQHRNDPFVPSHLQSKIHDLVYQHSDGLPLTHFSRIFSVHYGINLDPRQLGFQDEFEMLASIPSMVSVKRFQQGEMRVLPVVTTSTNSRHPSSTPVSKTSSSSPPPSQTLVKKDRSPSPKPPRHDEESDWDQLFDSGSCNIPEVVQRNIEKLMKERPDGIKASVMLFEYKKVYKTDLSMKTYGYNSVIEFVSDLSHIIRIERPNKFDWMLYPVKTSSQTASGPQTQNVPAANKAKINVKSSLLNTLSAPKSTSSNSTVCQRVEPELKEAISQVLGLNPKGIPLDRFMETFKEMTGQSIDVKKYGTDSVKGFLHSLTDVLYIMLDVLDEPIVCSIHESGPRRFNHLQDRYKPITPLPEMLSSESRKQPLFPAQAVTPGCHYKPQEVSYVEDEATQSYIELFVSFTTNPSHFWLQLRGQKTTLALENLMDALEETYGDPTKPEFATKGKDYHMTPELAQPGMVCAVIYPEDQYWHRGLITGHKDNLYEVFYVDYGNTCYVSLENIRFLKVKFLSLPAQAIRGRLSNVQPYRQTWALRAKQRFLDLTRDKALLGFVTAFKNRILSLCLTDTSGADDIHINDILTTEGYARFEPDKEESIAPEDTMSCSQVLTTDFLYGSGGGGGGDNDKKTGEAVVDSSNHAQSAATEAGSWQRYVRQAQMSDNIIFHLINLGSDDLYVMSAEVSSLFFEEDIISAKLRKDKTDITKVVVSKDSYPELYAELLSYEVPAVTESTSLLSLFPMKALPLMMELYGQDKKNLNDIKDTVLEILDWFDPNDPYWKGEDDNSTESGETDRTGGDSQSVVSDSKDSFKMEDLQMVLKMLQMKRNRSLKKLLEGGGVGDSKVDEVNSLNQVEIDIRRVEAFIESLEKKNGPDVVDQVTKASQSSVDIVKTKAVPETNHTHLQSSSIPAARMFSSTSTVAPQPPSSLKPQALPIQTSFPTVAPITATVAPTPHLASAASTSSSLLPPRGSLSAGGGGACDMAELMRQQVAINSWLMSQMGLTKPMTPLTAQPFSVEQLQQQQTLLQQQLHQQNLLLQQQQHQSLLPPSFLPPSFPITSTTSSSSLLLPSSSTLPAAPGFSHVPVMMNSQLNNLTSGTVTSSRLSNFPADPNVHCMSNSISNSQLERLANPNRKS